MRFRSLGFRHFRNLEDSLVPVDYSKIILVGENGQGKTNFLEALYVLCYGSSFRALNTRELIKHGEKEFALSAVVETDDGYNQQISFRFCEGKREILIDGREIRDRKELIYNIPCIVFSHDDIEFIRGTPENRRRFFDQTMSLYNPIFFDDLRRYRAILKQRNAAIKENYRSLIPLYDAQIAKLGFQIQQERIKAVKDFNEIFPSLYKIVSQSKVNLHIVYRPSWGECKSVEDICKKLEKTLDRDLKLQTTGSGIHRDQFIVMQDNENFALCGSTGQLRLASLIFRIAQVNSYRLKTGKNPVLLMDDVLLELDVTKRGLFLEQLGGYSQAFFTFLPDEHYFTGLADKDTLTYAVANGGFISV
jgi:DNA replication and repair protein RecF